jgi:hypothetical protein
MRDCSRTTPGASCLSSNPHNAGVRVSDTKAEITTAAVSVTENSRSNSTRMLLPNSSGANTAIKDSVIEITVKPISLTPTRDASSASSPCSICRTMFSITTIASSTTKPMHSTSATSDKVFSV